MLKKLSVLFHFVICLFGWMADASPEVVIAEERPVDDVQEDEARGEEPPRDALDENGLFPLFLHQIANFFLSSHLKMAIQSFFGPDLSASEKNRPNLTDITFTNIS